ncbi:MAG: hypothetical protein R3C00_04505, partial [Hyphomonas sp.]
MTRYRKIGLLSIHEGIYDFVARRLPNSMNEPAVFWQKYAFLLDEFHEENNRLLRQRDELQAKIDAYLSVQNGDVDTGLDGLLREIGYIHPDVPDFKIGTTDVDPEISSVAGPQLVVPLSNPRYALNALNARWGSLFDALYGSNVIPSPQCSPAAFDRARKEQVIAWAGGFLDQIFPLEDASHLDVIQYRLEVSPDRRRTLVADVRSGDHTGLQTPSQFKGYLGAVDHPSTLLLTHHGLHVELQIDPNHDVGKMAFGSVRDLLLEAALTVIQDLEDAVATVDAEDKLEVYKNWAGLLDGSLTETFQKADKTIHRR